MYSVNFFLRSPQETKESPIILYVNYGGRRIKCATGLKIHPELWSSDDQSPTSIARIVLKHNQRNPGTGSMLQIIKRTLSGLRKAVDDYFSLCQINGNEVSLDEIRSKIQCIIKPKQEKQTDRDKVCVFLDEFIADAEKGKRKLKGKNYKAGTIKNYRNLLQAIIRFQKFYGKTIKWESINKSLYAEFMDWQSHQNFSLNYSGKHAKDLKSIMRLAYEEGFHHNETFRAKWFAVPSERKESHPMSVEDMQKLFELPLQLGTTDCIARDAFLIGCYTGLRVSDIQRIEKKMIADAGNGRKRIKITTQKNDKNVVIPVCSQLDAILQRYDFKSPIFREQTVNRRIKKLSMDAGIDPLKASNVSFHVGRHSFATHLYYVENLPERDIMVVTGHSTERNFLRYVNAKLDEVATRMEQSKFFQ